MKQFHSEKRDGQFFFEVVVVVVVWVEMVVYAYVLHWKHKTKMLLTTKW